MVGVTKGGCFGGARIAAAAVLVNLVVWSVAAVTGPEARAEGAHAGPAQGADALPAIGADARLAQGRDAYTWLGQIGGATGGMAWHGDRLLAGVGPSLRVYDYSGPDHPVLVGALAVAQGRVRGVEVRGDTAYVAADRAGLLVLDVAGTTNPRLVGSLPIAGRAVDVTVVGDFAFVAGFTSGVHVVDVSDPAAPTLIQTVATGERPTP